MQIAILGSRGIPAEFGGFETFAEQLAVRLAASGFKVTVFCEETQQYRKSEFKGVRLRYLYTPNIVGLRSIWFDLLSIFMTLRGYDVVYMLGYHGGFTFFLPWLARTNFWTNMDGHEWKRTKWSKPVQMYLKINEFLAAKLSRRLVADAQGIADSLNDRIKGIRDKTLVISYGAYVIKDPPNPAPLFDYGLEPNCYYLIVCRLEPENHVQELVEGFIQSDTNRRLIIIGDISTNTPYVQSLLAYRGKKISFIGTVFDQKTLTVLRYYCAAYLHGHSVGGTNPSLLEAMACGNFVICHDNVFNREVTSELGWYFSNADDINKLIKRFEREGIPIGYANKVYELVENKYNWDMVVNTYKRFFKEALND